MTHQSQLLPGAELGKYFRKSLKTFKKYVISKMLDKSFKGDLQSQIHTIDAASNTTNQLASYKHFRRVFMHYSRILFQCNQDYKMLYRMPKGAPSCICTAFLYIPFACAFHAKDYSIDFKSFLQLLFYRN